MTAWRVVVAAQRVLVWVVLVISGAYMVIYLYRWEWNRAIISGLFFVAAEVALATAMLIRRLRSLEHNLGPTSAAPASALTRLRATPVSRSNPFRWLDPKDGELGVFVPVLLGAGVILSAFAYVVERIATATAVPVLDRDLASRLGSIAAPADGLRTRPSREPEGLAPTGSRWESLGTSVAGILAIGAIVVMGWLGVNALMDAAQTRADPADRPARTTIEMTVSQRRTRESAVSAAEALWVGCRSTLGRQPTEAHVEGLAGERVALVLEPGIGRLTTRRLTGCLADLRVNLVIATVLDVDSTPPADT